MTRLGDCVLVMLEAIPYDGLMQRHQHLAREMARFLPVVYVESTPSRVRSFLDGKPFDPSLNAYRRGLVDTGSNVFLFKAPPCVPRWGGYYKSALATSRRTARSLIPLLPSGKRVILWLFSPYAVGAFGLYDEVLTVLDCFDAFGEFPGEERYKTEIVAATEECARKATLVVATSEELAVRLQGHSKRVEIVPNGCDPEHFALGRTITPRGKLLLDREKLKHPVIGYMGDIAPWVDLNALMLVAESRPAWSIVLLGTWKRGRHPILNLLNVYVPGRVPYEELPYYAGAFDVGTIPFGLSSLTRVVNPLKLYEYFALGIPVVASELPEVARHGDLVYVAQDYRDFLAKIDSALGEKPDSGLRERRMAVAKENSWRSRAEKLRDVLSELLK